MLFDKATGALREVAAFGASSVKDQQVGRVPYRRSWPEVDSDSEGPKVRLPE